MLWVVVVILFPEEYTKHMHNINHNSNFTKCIPLAVAREAQRLIELTTASLLFPDVSSTLYSQYEWFNICESHIYRQVSNIRRTLVGNKIVNHSDVVGASPVLY